MKPRLLTSKPILILAALTLMLILLAACGGAKAPAEPTQAPEPTAAPAEATQAPEPTQAPAESSEKIKIKYMYFETPALTPEFWEKHFANIEAQFPNVEIVPIVATADSNDFLKQLIASGQPPDIAHASQPSEFATGNILIPYDNDWLDEHFLYPRVTEVDGVSLAPPYAGKAVPFVYYNKSIFKELGVDVPTTWAEFLDIAEKAKAAGYVPVLMPGTDGWSTSQIPTGIITADVIGDVPDWLQQRKADKVKFADDNMVAAVSKFQSLIEKGYIDQGALGLDYANANRTFVEGKAAMYPMGSWFIQQASKEANFDVGIFLMPRDDGEAIVPAVVQGSVVVLASSEHPDLSMEIAKWMTTSPVYMKMLMEADAVFPMLKGMSVEDYNADVSDLYLEGLSYFNDDKGKAVSSFCWTNDVNSPLPGMKAEIYSSYQNIASGADVKAEMEHLDKVWEDTAKRLSQ